MTPIQAGFSLYESRLLDGAAGLFPSVVFAGIVVLGLCVCVQIRMAPVEKCSRSDNGACLHIAITFGIAMLTYLLIPVLGFYCSIFLCILVMLGYSTLRGEATSKAFVFEWGRGSSFFSGGHSCAVRLFLASAQCAHARRTAHVTRVGKK